MRLDKVLGNYNFRKDDFSKLCFLADNVTGDGTFDYKGETFTVESFREKYAKQIAALPPEQVLFVEVNTLEDI